MRTLNLLVIGFVAAGASVAACSSGPGGENVVVGGWAQPPSGSGTSGGGGSDGGSVTLPDGGVAPLPDGGKAPLDAGKLPDGGTPPPGDAGGNCVPSNVATMLASLCTGCHSDPPVNGSLAGLVTYADLMATAHEDATKNEAQLSLSRMQNSASPMPPGALPPSADATILQDWINAGYPGSCTSADGGPPPPPPPPPTSVFTGAPPFSCTTGSDSHNAGRNCLGCHNFNFGGTVVDGSGNAVAGAEVRVVDSAGVATSICTGPSGTFHIGGSSDNAPVPVTWPARVGVRNATVKQDMVTALATASAGGCSSCHGPQDCTGGTCSTTVVHLP
jgi:hypothetical protein